MFQSYSVYTPELAERNRKHLLEKGRPDNIFFKIQPIDGRLPSLEDGASWPAILTHYRPNAFLKEYLILKLPEKEPPSSLDEDRWPKQIGHFNQWIDLPDSDQMIFLKLHIRQTFIGRVLNILFKPDELAIMLALKNGELRSYRLITGMARAGFLLSPLIENAQEFALLYDATGHLVDKKVKAILVHAKGSKSMWREGFEIQLSSLTWRKLD